MFYAIIFSELCRPNGATSGRYWIEAFTPLILAYQGGTTSSSYGGAHSWRTAASLKLLERVTDIASDIAAVRVFLLAFTQCPE